VNINNSILKCNRINHKQNRKKENMNEGSSNNKLLGHRGEFLADPSRAGAWVAGIILIVLGAGFLIHSTTNFDISLKNWWALFILIPIVGAIDTAIQTYRTAGNHLTGAARSALFVGILLALVTLGFLFDISWNYLGPILITLAGSGILFNAMIDKKE
jgi:hypothetical protein